MKPLALGIFEDLRQRRLLPVAGLLLVVLIALPVVLMKGAATPAAPVPSATTISQPAGLPSPSEALNTDKPLVTLAVLQQASDLDTYTQKDPFKPLKSLSASKKASDKLPGPTDTSASSGGAAAGPSGGSSGGGGSSQSSGGSPQSTTPSPSTGNQPAQPKKDSGNGKTEALTYALDATLEGPHRKVSYRALPKLTAMPNAANPLLIYLGVDSTGKNAVFLVDASLKVIEGEGACSPSNDPCGTLKLQPGELETFQDANGQRYTVTIDQIREVSAASAARETEKHDKASASAAHASDRPGRTFMPPVITDLFKRSN